MPTRDAQLLFSDAQDLTTAVGTVVSEDVVYIPQVTDHTGTARNDRPNVQGGLHLNIIVDTIDMLAAVAGCILTINLLNDTDTTPTTGGDTILSKEITIDTPAVNFVAGTQIMSVPLPVGILKPYFGINYVVSVQDLSTGSVSAWLGPAIQNGGEHGAL